MRLYPLDKKVFLLKGNPVQFLNGLTSNTLDKPQNAFLNMHGRIIATVDQLRLSDDEFILVLASSAVAPFMAHVERYLKLNRSQLSETALNVYFDLDSDAPVSTGDLVLAQKKGRLLLSEKTLAPTITEIELTLFRLEHQLPLHMVDYHDQMLLNIHEYDFVSYTKGCFLGQEAVAKVHNRSKPSWVLAVRYQDELTQEDQQKMTSCVINPPNGRCQGFVFLPNT